jgi:hypothetical protein
MTESPVQQLLSQLKPLIARHRMAYDITWKRGDNPQLVTEAKARMAQEELMIEDVIRTWTYRELISELKKDEYNHVGHDYQPGILHIIDYLRENRPELGGEDDKG